MKHKYDLFIFAGEASGDLHGAELIKKLKKTSKELYLCGVCGPHMREFEIDTLMKTEEFQVMGFTDILFSLFKIIKNFLYLKKLLLKINPKACLFIDYPEFNLKLQSALRKEGYKGKLIHYICPSVWAWRKKRIYKMKKNLDLLLCIYPFEISFLQNHLKAEYVGHPLISKLKNYKYDKNWHFSQSSLIGIFPGSRKKEIQRNLPIQLNAAKEIIKRHPDFSFIVSICSKDHENLIFSISENFKEIFKENLIFMSAFKNYDLMKNIKFAIATSGTINLELALHKVPTIVTYYIKPLDLFIAKNLLKITLPYYCIVNILGKKMIFPELYGPVLTQKNLLFYLNKLLVETTYKTQIIKDCENIINALKNAPKKNDVALSVLNILIK